MVQENGDENILNSQEDADLSAAHDEDNSDGEGESVEEYKARLAKAEELATNYKIRAEKAEKLARQKPSESSKPISQELDNPTLARIYGVHEDDFDFVANYSKFNKLSIAETLKLDEVKAKLSNNSEFRKTAEVSSTSGGRKGVTKVSDDTLVANLSKGEVPEAGTNEAERLFWARNGGKR